MSVSSGQAEPRACRLLRWSPMRRVLLLALLLPLLYCGGDDDASPADPSISISDAQWQGDGITFIVDSNLPDGALLSWAVFDDPTETDVDAPFVSDRAAVAGGSASVTASVSDFSNDESLIEVNFVPGFAQQPDAIRNAYEPNQGASNAIAVSPPSSARP
jgi:hypothetical protein